MYYALIHYLEKYPEEIDLFRRSHDPRFDITKPHLTFVFPIKEKIDEDELIEHIKTIICEQKAFDFTLSGIQRSWDDLVFLLVDQGKDKIIKLHDDLYSNTLRPFLRADIEYIPHLTLGELKESKTLEEAQKLNINFSTKLNRLTLIKRETEMSPVIWSKEFVLNLY